MKDEQYTEIEQQIGYEFENRLLLQQLSPAAPLFPSSP